MNGLPDPKEIVDSMADGACTVLSVGPKLMNNCATSVADWAKNVDSDFANLRNDMPDKPEALPDTILKLTGHTVNGAFSTFEGAGRAVLDTCDGVRKQINRVVR